MRSPSLRHVITHLITPLLMCLGMGLAYMGAFVTPEPHHLPVAVVGSGPQAKVFAQTVKDEAGDKLDVRTVATRSEAVDLLNSRDITGAYVPGARAPELVVASAASDMDATAVEKVFTPVAAAQGVALKVTDVAAPVDDDPTGQGLFFLLIALSIGSYASVAALGAAGGTLPMRMRALLALGVSAVVSGIGALLAGPVFHLAHHDLAQLWGMAWLYSAGILFVGVGLHVPQALDHPRHDGAVRDAQLHQLRRAVPPRPAERLLRHPPRLLERRRIRRGRPQPPVLRQRRPVPQRGDAGGLAAARPRDHGDRRRT